MAKALLGRTTTTVSSLRDALGTDYATPVPGLVQIFADRFFRCYRRQGPCASRPRGHAFLDEVAELPLDVQSKLLRMLETREVLRLGATKVRRWLERHSLEPSAFKRG